MASTAALLIVEEVIDELTNRKGLRQQWDDVDTDIQIEIQATMAERVDGVLRTEELLMAARQLLAASFQDYGDLSKWPDDASVTSDRGYDSAIKFGHLRRLQASIDKF